MKRTILHVVCLLVLLGSLPLASGCATGRGRYFHRTREGKPLAFRNRIYNPADYRYHTDCDD